MEVCQSGNLIVADVVASSVGEEGDALSGWTHLEEGRESETNYSHIFHFQHFTSNEIDFSLHLAREDIQAIPQTLGVLLQLLELVGYAVVGWVGQIIGRVRQDRQGVYPGLE